MWTNEQLDAIYESGSNILVSAGAGSGKTTVLTERIINKILSGISLKELIILTFTNAASKSMKQKIKKAIIKRIECETDEEKRNIFINELDYIDQANISTFDSFTMALISKYAHLLNISSNISIMDETEKTIITKKLFEEVFKEMIGEKNPFFYEMLDKYTIRNYNKLIDAINILYNKKLSNIVNLDAYLDSYMDNYMKNMDKSVDAYEKYIFRKKEEIIFLINELNEVNPEGYDFLYKKGLNYFINASSIDELIKVTKIDFPKSNTFNEEGQAIKRRISAEYRAFFAKEIFPLEECMKAYLEQKNSQNALIEILKRFKRKYENYIIKTNYFSYSDISLFVIKLLKENKNICDEIKYNTKEILVDEYQDTSDIQEELLKLISNNNCYMVGDIKQSIYRFRNANPNIFQDKFDKYGKNIDGIRIDLTKNFRSRKEVLDDINEMYNDIMTPDFGGIDYHKEHMLVHGNDKYIGSIKEGIEFFVHTNKYAKTKTEKEKIEDCKNNFKEILADILDKMEKETVCENGEIRKPKFEDFAILTRNKSNYSLYDSIAKENNIPLVIEHELPFARNEEIYALTAILNYLLDENDILSYFSILRSFLFNENDEKLLLMRKNNDLTHEAKDICDEIRKKIDLLSLDNLIQLIYDSFHFYEKIHLLNDPANSELRLMFILNKTKDYAKMGFDYNYLLDYLTTIQTTRVGNKEMDISFSNVEKTDSKAISLMTIHKSKGLEFPFCYIIETNTTIGSKDNQNFFNFSQEYGITFKPFNKEYFLNQVINKQNKLLQLYEDTRILYVALTRAMERVVIYLDNYDSFGKKEKKQIDIFTKEKYSYLEDMICSGYASLEKHDNKILQDPLTKEKETFEGKKISFKKLTVTNEKEKKSIASTSINRLISKEEKDTLEYGTRLHKILENFDFLHPVITEEKEIIDSFLKQDFFKKDIIQAYHELEFIDGETNGIIDLILETKNEMIIVDYKTSDIEKEEYVKQVETYVTYLKKITNKEVSGYLYSLLQRKVKKVQ